MKPPYRIPSMREIEQLPDKGLRIVSTFSGCGGSCLGFRWAGFRTLWASEFIPVARAVYRLNHPGVPVDARDIRQVKPEDILQQIGKSRGELDVLEGSPPCAAFSPCGDREAGWGTVRKYSETRQRVDDLFFEFVRILDGLQPRAFVAENVAGLVRGVAKGYFKMILGELRRVGYEVEARILDAQYLGVPQVRGRLIFIGIRNDLGLKPVFPKPLPYQYTLRDALGDNLLACDGMSTNVKQRPISCKLLDEWYKLPEGGQSRRYFNLVKAHRDKPCPAIVAEGGNIGAASVAHPLEPRKFTIAELLRLAGFPDDFQLVGTFRKQWERIGRAVPPPMMRAVAEQVADVLGRKR